MSIELGHCPCCGSPAEFFDITEGENIGGCCIACTGSLCGLTTDLMFSLMEDCRPILAERWNRRAAPSQPEGAEPTWPKLTKPATVGAGTFGVGVSARLVVESAQRHYECAQEERDNPKTPEQRRDAEMSRRRLWDMLNGVTEAGAAAPDEGEGWQPIATASKDGSPVLAYSDRRTYLVWDGAHTKHFEVIVGEGSFEVNPTHWMPLPSAPKGKRK